MTACYRHKQVTMIRHSQRLSLQAAVADVHRLRLNLILSLQLLRRLIPLAYVQFDVICLSVLKLTLH